MDVAVECYELTGDFPRSEAFGMTSQIRRAAASIPANIAEGHGRESTGAYIHHLKVSQGSLKELETHLLLSSRLGLGSLHKLELALSKCDEVGRMLRSMIRSLQDRK